MKKIPDIVLTAWIVIVLALAATAHAGDACCPTDKAAAPASTGDPARCPVEQPGGASSAPAQAACPVDHGDSGKAAIMNVVDAATPRSAGAPGHDADHDHDAHAGAPLPAGHPPVPPMLARPATQPAASKATLVVRAKQGTPGGAAVAGDRVLVQWYRKEAKMQPIETKLDAHGVVILEDLPLGNAAQAAITVTHAGVDHDAVTQIITPAQATQQVDINVFESTDAKPEWTVKNWHVMVDKSPHGLVLTHMMTIHNPADRNWTGAAPDDKGRRLTLAIDLPEGTRQLDVMEGLHDCCTKFENRRLITSQPMRPGLTKIQFRYLIVPVNGSAKIELSTPAPVESAMVIVPDDPTTFSVEGVGPALTMAGGKAKIRYHKATNLAINAKPVILASGLPEPVKTAGQGPKDDSANPYDNAAASSDGPATATSQAGRMSKLIAGIGGLVLLAAGIVYILAKGGSGKGAAQEVAPS